MALLASQLPSWLIDPEIYTFCPYAVVTSSLNSTGSAVACVQAVPVAVAAVVVVVEVVEPHKPVVESDEAGMRARGRPEVIGTGMFPLESTVMDVHVYSSISLVPEEYPLPLKDNV